MGLSEGEGPSEGEGLCQGMNVPIHKFLLPTDRDSTLLSSAIIFFEPLVADQNISVVEQEGFSITSLPTQILITPSQGVASIASFQTILRSTTYFTSKPLE